MLENYLPILIFLAVSVVIGGAALGAGMLVGNRRPDAAKDSP